MKTANVADLRNNFPRLATWIADGESIEIRKRGVPFATLVPAKGGARRRMPKIDFEGRLKKIWGDRFFTDREISAMRQAERDGEEG